MYGKYFVSGKAAKHWDRFNPDWIPIWYLGHDKRVKTSEKFSANLERRLAERRKRRAWEKASETKELKP